MKKRGGISFDTRMRTTEPLEYFLNNSITEILKVNSTSGILLKSRLKPSIHNSPFYADSTNEILSSTQIEGNSLIFSPENLQIRSLIIKIVPIGDFF